MIKTLKIEILAFLGVVFTYITVLSMVMTDSFYILGNLHDLWIPQISAQAIKQGLTQHVNFNSSFGFFYSYLNYISLCIIEYFPKLFSKSDLITLSSLQFSIVLIIIFFITKLNSFINKTSWLLLPLILSINFQLRNISKPFHFADILWYGSYNAHLWSLLLIQISSVLDFYVYQLKEPVKDISKLKFVVFIFIQFICAYITLNYKINFFIASVSLASSIFFFLNREQKKIYFSLLLLVGIVSVFLTEILTGYSYSGYFKDILQSIKSKRTTGYSHFLNLFIFLIFFIPLIFRSNRNFKSFKNLKKFSPDFFLNLYRKRELVFPSFYFCLSISICLLVGVVGDWQKPATYFLIVLCLFSIQTLRSKKVIFFCWLTLSGMFFLNCFSNLYASNPEFFKLTEKHRDKYGEGSYKKINLLKSDKSFIINNHQGSFELFKFLKINTSEPDTIFNISSTYRAGEKKWGLPFRNVEYAQLINDAVIAVEDYGYEFTDKILMLEFVNPLPILLDTKIPQNTFHWVHLGTTFSKDNIEKMNILFKELDIVYVPTITMDGFSQTFINCSFYKWNDKTHRFKPYSVSASGILFVSDSRAKRSVKKPLSYDKSMLRKNCRESINLAHKLWE